MDNLYEAYLGVYSSEAWEPITQERQARIDRAKEKSKQKEEIAQHQRKPLEVQKQYTRGKALKFKKKMTDIGMNAPANQREEVDLFNYLLEYLIAEGYADTNDAAIKIMANMSEEWRTEIVEAEEARNNPEKYEAGQKKKYAPVRGERRPMPPRGNPDREAFEKWYAKQMGR